MTTYKRIFCVLLAFVLLFVQFLPLHTVHATENNEDYGISLMNLEPEDFDGQSVNFIQGLYCGGNTGKVMISKGSFYLADGFYQWTGNISLDGFDPNNNSFLERFTFDKVDGSRLFSKGSQVNFSLSNMINNIEYTDENGNSYKFDLDPTAVHTVYFYTKDISGQYTKVKADSFSFKKVNGYYHLDATCNSLPTDCYQLIMAYEYNYSTAYGWSGLTYRSGITRNFGFVNSVINFDETEDDGTKGLLANIIALINNIKDGITNLPSKIANSIKGFFDNVVNAVTNVMNAVTNIGDLIKNAIINLGTFLIDGIKGLFVPSEEDITEMKDRWTDLLRDRFGALYQTVELIDSYGKSFQAQEKNTITMPSIDLSLAGAVFTFGGWEVQVVPEGFDVLFNALKLIISIVCTIWFVNGLKNRFEKLVGGADNI